MLRLPRAAVISTRLRVLLPAWALRAAPAHGQPAAHVEHADARGDARRGAARVDLRCERRGGRRALRHLLEAHAS